jgi:hypothetical protein
MTAAARSTHVSAAGGAVCQHGRGRLRRVLIPSKSRLGGNGVRERLNDVNG